MERDPRIKNLEKIKTTTYGSNQLTDNSYVIFTVVTEGFKHLSKVESIYIQFKFVCMSKDLNKLSQIQVERRSKCVILPEFYGITKLIRVVLRSVTH